MAVTVLIGGARSGKSALALQIARAWTAGVTYIATGEPGDDEMTDRIEQHRAERDPGWATIEEPIELAKAIESAPSGDLLIVDCLTLWISNLIGRDVTAGEITQRAQDAVTHAAERATPTIVVTNEVGAGIVPVNAVAREYRDLLGAVNSTFAAAARDVLYVAAGRAVSMKHFDEVVSDVLDG
jgi:adenosyl cobinamide kinase/adenosyl cobinamide phosphate guanylyltransferase